MLLRRDTAGEEGKKIDITMKLPQLIIYIKTAVFYITNFLKSYV